jgi:hypothetical protein
MISSMTWPCRSNVRSSVSVSWAHPVPVRPAFRATYSLILTKTKIGRIRTMAARTRKT